MDTALVELKNIKKSFGGVLALDGVNFRVERNEIIGLIGDNGAGKSTLIKIITGVYSSDSGEIYINGKKMERWTAAMSRKAGIETVYQDKALVEQQTITRNIFMGREQTGFLGFIKMKEQQTKADLLMRNIGFTSKVFSADSIVSKLSGGEKQGVAIARALYFNANLIILDEPTTALSLVESEKVMSFVRKVKEEGKSCIFISHNIYHAYDVADSLVLMDRGRIIMKVRKKDISIDGLLENLHSLALTGGVQAK